MLKHDRHWIINFGILLLYFKIAKTQNAPQIPCPENFKYISFVDNHIGLVTLNKLTLKNITVEIGFTQNEPITSNHQGSLSLNRDLQSTQKNLEDGTPISYRVDFPNPHIIPKLKFIKVNGDTICSGDGLDAPSTTFTLRHTFYPKESTTTSAKTDPNKNDDIPVNRSPANVPVNSPSDESGYVGCGREGITPLIPNGNDIPRGKFPWLAAIYLRDRADLKFTCGGSLISSRTVITAAHCFPTPNFSPDLISVYLGRHNLFVSEDGSQQRDVASLTMHPDYNISAMVDADIALLHFTVEVTFSQYIRPVCLWTQQAELSFIEEQKGFIAGWGSDTNGIAVTSVAKMVEAKIVSEAECLRSSNLFRILTSSRSLCAGNRDGSGPCIGDSGGGLMLNVFGVWTLRGILSVGEPIQHYCDLNEFVVYCDVAKHITWVRQNMN